MKHMTYNKSQGVWQMTLKQKKKHHFRNTLENNDKGFTIMEVLIALAVFSIGILAVASLQVSSRLGNRSFEDITHATHVLDDVVESFLNLPYHHSDLNDTDADGTGGLDNNTGPTADGSTVLFNNRYNVFWNVALDSPVNDTKTINVIVTWITPTKGPRSVSFRFVKQRDV